MKKSDYKTPLNERDGVNPTILAIAEAWEIFRKDTLPEIHSFADMIEIFIEKGKTPPLDVLVVDEAQDLAELNWRLVEKLVREIYLPYILQEMMTKPFTNGTDKTREVCKFLWRVRGP